MWGVFAGNQPQTYDPLHVFDAYDARFDYFCYYLPEQAPPPAPSNLVTRAVDYRVDPW